MTKEKKEPTAEIGTETAATDRTSTTEKTSTGRKTPWFRLAVIVLFALFYAYDLFESVTNTFGVVGQINRFNEYAELTGTNTSTIPWAALIANMLLPVAVFGLGLLVARKRNVGVLAIVLLAGLGVVGAVTLSLTAVV